MADWIKWTIAMAIIVVPLTIIVGGMIVKIAATLAGY